VIGSSLAAVTIVDRAGIPLRAPFRPMSEGTVAAIKP